MFYEGNDFRGSGELTDRAYKYSSFRYRFKTYIKTSPVIIAVKVFFMQKFSIGKGPFGSQIVKAAPDLHAADDQKRTNAVAESIQQQFHSWLPVAIPPDRAIYYYFNVKRLLCHYTDMDDLAESGGWQTIRKAIDALNQMCTEHGIRLVILYALQPPCERPSIRVCKYIIHTISTGRRKGTWWWPICSGIIWISRGRKFNSSCS